MESKNPAFNNNTLNKLRAAGVMDSTASMTVNGTINKVGILVTLTVISSCFAYSFADQPWAMILALGSILANLILCFVIIYNKDKSPVLAPVYAVIEGLSLGFIAYYADASSQGVAVQAFIATFAILFAMLGLYRLKIITATPFVRRVVYVSMLGILFTYTIDIILMFFGAQVPMVHQGSTTGILFSLFVIGIASLNFTLDFDMVERAVEARMPRYMEWYAGFSILLTIIWLYVEILRLLGKRR